MIIEELMEQLPNDLMLGLTVFPETEKKWLVCSYYAYHIDILGEEDSIISEDVIKDYTEGTWYGSTPIIAIIKAIDEIGKREDEKLL